MVFLEQHPSFKNWFEIYRSVGCCLLAVVGVYTLFMTTGSTRCVSIDDETFSIMSLVYYTHCFSAVFFSVDQFILVFVKKMWRNDLFFHHCVCLFLLVYFTPDFPLIGCIFYAGEALTCMNWLRPTHPLFVTVWRLAVVFCCRFPVFGAMFLEVYFQDEACILHHKSGQLACSIFFFFLYDIYVVKGCIDAINKELEKRKNA